MRRVVIKLNLNCSVQFGKFFLDFELLFLYRGYYIKFMVFGKELEVQEVPGRLLRVWAGFRSRQGFPGRGRVFLVLCRNRGPLYCNMARRLDAVARSRHSFSMS